MNKQNQDNLKNKTKPSSGPATGSRLEKSEKEKTDQVAELTADLQRVRADFENYRKRTEAEINNARQSGSDAMVLKLLPVIDTLERAIGHLPEDIAKHNWVKGVAGVAKNLDKTLASLDIKRIAVKPGQDFDPELHYAVQIDEESTGEKEVIAEELQAGYVRSGVVLRHAMVKVTRK